MNYLKKLGKSLLLTLISIIFLSFLLNIVYNFNIINNNIYNIMKMTIVLIVLFINAFLLGKKSIKHGIIEGLKLGALFLIMMLILKITLNSPIDIRTFIYSIIILLTTSIGAILGINKKSKN